MGMRCIRNAAVADLRDHLAHFDGVADLNPDVCDMDQNDHLILRGQNLYG